MATATQIQQLYIAYFNRPADPAGLAYWMKSTMSINAIAESFAAQTEYSSLYAGKTTVQVVNTIFNNLFGRDADTAGLLYWAGQINDGKTTLGNAAISILGGATGADAVVITSKTTAAESFTTSLDLTTEIVAYGSASAFGAAKAWLAGVTNAATLATAVSTKDGVIAGFSGNAVAGQTLSLTTNLDNLVGTSAADTFLANVVQNSLGEQTNQLATGDRIVGGAGTPVDTLEAVVQKASALNNTPSSAITPITTGVEKAMFTALSVNNNNLLSAEEIVNINAKSMTGLTHVGSVQSDASLFVQNLTTLTDDGKNRNTETITIRMDHTGNDKAADKESNMTVLFDNDYLLSNSSDTFKMTIDVVNNLPLKLNKAPLTDFETISFKVGGKTFVFTLTDALRNEKNTTSTSNEAYGKLVDAMNVALAAEFGAGKVVATAPTSKPSIFSIDFPASGSTPAITSGEVAGNYSPILITSSLELAKGPIEVNSSETSFNGANTENLGDSTTDVAPITSKIELFKVGRGAEGGSLVVGGMSTDLENKWDYSATALKEGVEKFVVKVIGDQTQMSSLSNLSSTNNTLQTVDVSWDTGSLADLIIGNHNTTGAIGTVNGANTTVNGVANVSSVQNLALKDVRTFAATNGNSKVVNPTTTLTNDVTVNAYLSDEVVAKYMDRAHSTTPTSAKFAYTTGAGNDVINMNISKTNLSESGNSAREDFTLAINAGDGNNKVVTQIGNGVGITADAWYTNQSIQKNLSITTGAGTDYVHVNGAGSWDIKTGGGNDVIYSDNSGRQVIDTNAAGTAKVESNATWVFNTSNQTQNTGMQPLYDLTSAAAVTATANKIANLEVTVSFRGIVAKAIVEGTDSATGAVVTDQSITQAIKKAINEDVYLKNLLSAADGTGRALVVTSLTDGVFSDADISVTMANGVAISSAQTTAGAAYLTAAQYTALGFTGGTANVGGRFDSAIAEDASTRSQESAVVTWNGMVASTAEVATVTWTAFAAAGTQTIGGMTITAVGAATAADVATVAGGGAVGGLSITTTSTTYTAAAAVGATNVFTATATNLGNVTNVTGSVTGVGNTAPSATVVDGVTSTQTIGGMTISNVNNAAVLANQVAQIAGGGAAIAGLTITTASTLFTAATAVGATNVFSSTTLLGNVADITGAAFTGAGNAVPTAVITQGVHNAIVGANSAQASTNVIDAGLGFDTVVASTAGGTGATTLAKGVITVADTVPQKDVVFNVSGGTTVVVDTADYVVSASGFILSGGAGTVAVLNTGIDGTAGNDTIDGTNVLAGLTIKGLAGNDTITASLLGGTVNGGAGADIITFASNTAADTLVFDSLVGADTIVGYNVTNDSISLSLAAFVATPVLAVGALNAANFVANATGLATAAGHNFIYNTTTGALSFDADGNGAGAAVLLATFTGIPALTAGEFTIIA
nr:DUF4214 domain-containing protein [uncultured Undibacterium sp.]